MVKTKLGVEVALLIKTKILKEAKILNHIIYMSIEF